MTEETNEGFSVEEGREGADRMTVSEAEAFFAEGMEEVFLPGIAGEDQADLFSPGWEGDEKFGERKDRQGIADRRERIINLASAETQERDEKDTKAYVTPPEKGENIYLFGLVKERNGVEEFIEGQATIGDVIFAYRAMDTKEAEEQLDFMRNHVRVKGKENLLYAEFEENRLIPLAKKKMKEEEEWEELQLGRRLAFLSEAEEELEPEYYYSALSEAEEESQSSDAEPEAQAQEEETIEMEKIPGLIADIFEVPLEKAQNLYQSLIGLRDEQVSKESWDRYLESLKETDLFEIEEDDEQGKKEKALNAAEKVYNFLGREIPDLNGEDNLEKIQNDLLNYLEIELREASKMEAMEALRLKIKRELMERGTGPFRKQFLGAVFLMLLNEVVASSVQEGLQAS